TFKAVQSLGFIYDCSIEDGYQKEHDGRNYNWPYTLDNGSPGHDALVAMGSKKFTLDKYPGLWEMPAYPFLIPPDESCEKYGVARGFRSRLHALQPWFDTTVGKITGFDYNLWYDFRMTKKEFTAILKYTFDLRMEGNRAPFLIGTHSQYYSDKCPPASGSTAKERQEALAEFIDYVLMKPDTRVVPYRDVLAWCRKPVALHPTGLDHSGMTKQPSDFIKTRVAGRSIYVETDRRFTESRMLLSLYSVAGTFCGTVVATTNTAGHYRGTIDPQIAPGCYLVKIDGHFFMPAHCIIH
ncbi:MAG: hypothetical protein JW795_22535, partial [Chitinivibrionales bacterium]|nr:hypothetical protein [Chitinivibrionales bacterium]